jgi:ABC-type transport system involved in multi-copper enzyme maturation permease subunit
MNAAVLIASRELRERSRLFLIAAAMAVVPFVAALAVRENRSLAIATVAGVLAIAYSTSLALALGSSAVGRELTEKRMSFLFAKPVSPASIWAGKTAAALLTVFAALAIVILPTYLFASGGWRDMWTAGGSSIVTWSLIASVALFFAGHAGSTMLRSRSALIGLDFLAVVILLFALYRLIRPILLGGAHELAVRMLYVTAGLLVLVLAIAPVWQLSRGRVDIQRNHRALSAFLWSGAALVLIGVAAFSWWVISAPLESIDERHVVEQSPTGEWLYASGTTKGRGSYLTSYLVNTVTGERERIPLSPWGEVHFSRDGRMIAWLEPADLLPPIQRFRLRTRRLERGAKQVSSKLEMPMPHDAALSEDGSRIAVIVRQQLQVYDIATGNLLGAAQGFNGQFVSSMLFAGPNLVRVIECCHPPAAMLRVRDFDLANRKVTTNFERTGVKLYGTDKVTGDGSRILLRPAAEVVDMRSGATVAALPIKREKVFFITMLRDGSTIVTRDSKLYHFDPTGKLAGEVPLPVKAAGVAGQIGASKLLLGVTGQDPSQWRMLIVDLATHKLERTVDGVLGPVPAWTEPVMRQFPEDATFIGIDRSRKMVTWDARTGATRPFPG